jgi:hypothetical protein
MVFHSLMDANSYWLHTILDANSYWLHITLDTNSYHLHPSPDTNSYRSKTKHSIRGYTVALPLALPISMIYHTLCWGFGALGIWYYLHSDFQSLGAVIALFVWYQFYRYGILLKNLHDMNHDQTMMQYEMLNEEDEGEMYAHNPYPIEE